jgi:hypothetical protein
MKKMENNFQNTFNQLKSILKKFEKNLRVKADSDNNYCLNAGYDEKRKADIYFGAASNQEKLCQLSPNARIC